MTTFREFYGSIYLLPEDTELHPERIKVYIEADLAIDAATRDTPGSITVALTHHEAEEPDAPPYDPYSELNWELIKDISRAFVRSSSL